MKRKRKEAGRGGQEILREGLADKEIQEILKAGGRKGGIMKSRQTLR